jgi:citronellol/citronellal dehydrogenase
MTTRTLAGKTILVSGGSRGIGLAIALRAARDGASIVLLAKTATPHPKLEGTIYTAAEQVEAAGGRAVPVTLGFADELADKGIAANSLWPRTTIGTAAIRNLLGGEVAVRKARTPDIMADAAHAILTRDSQACTGNFYTDEDVLREEGVTDFSGYRLAAREGDLDRDFFLPDAPLPARA